MKTTANPAPPHFAGLRAIADLAGIKRGVLVHMGERAFNTLEGIEALPVMQFAEDVLAGTLRSDHACALTPAPPAPARLCSARDTGSSRRGVVCRPVRDPAQRIAALVRRVADEHRAPQDIEWAIDGGELWLLQARPITGLPQEPHFEVPPGRWTKDNTHWSGPMTPASASVLLPARGASHIPSQQST